MTRLNEIFLIKENVPFPKPNCGGDVVCELETIREYVDALVKSGGFNEETKKALLTIIEAIMDASVAIENDTGA